MISRATRYMSSDILDGAAASTPRRHAISHQRSPRESHQRSPTRNQRRRLDTSPSPPPAVQRPARDQTFLNMYKWIQKLVLDRRNPTSVRNAIIKARRYRRETVPGRDRLQN